ncbi:MULTISPECIES: heme exporter protein CcmD [Halomonas]|uniref:Heme exporter protein D n=1 Tax=Halomonas ventosae TaxID=229007 RepID=A0A4V3BZE6_9GAMM|nr:heme exporter protein CcmD [Halomonas ventosae]TDO06249.1 heme exporter protein D [Halomonas ventosae]
MAFDSLSAFLAMGGHGAYVWAAWGVTGLLLVAVVLHARAERRVLLRDLRRRARRTQGYGAAETQVSHQETQVSHQEGHVHES